ncbi:MAG: hypothetical protein ACSHXY_06070 [Alphaproteobacteria bacterium]
MESLQDVPDAVEVSKAHIWKIEKERAKNPSMDLVTRLADAIVRLSSVAVLAASSG